MEKIIDAHNHISEALEIETLFNSYRFCDLKEIKSVSGLNIAVGLHPLYLEDDFGLIEKLLIENSHYTIGEVGLDRRGDNKEEQLAMLNSFIELASRYKRSITFHCVKSWGTLVNAVEKGLDNELPTIFHGFSGSREIMNRLKNRNSYFSFSERELKSEKIIQIIKSVPIEKLLIESDMLDSEYKKIGNALYIDGLRLSYSKIATIRNIPIDQFTDIIHNNFKHFLRSDQ